jgi:predicted phosphodiesterase
MKYEWLRPFATTETHTKILDALIDEPTVVKAAGAVGITERNVYEQLRRMKNEAATKNITASSDTSTLYGEDGEVRLQWVKTRKGQQEKQEAMREFVDELCDTVKPRKRQKAPKHTEKDLMTGIPIGDHHWGLLCWAPEVGENYDLKEAERLLTNGIDYLVDASPPSETALLANLGDFLHVNDRTNKTPGHGHLLDADGRFSKIARAAARGLAHATERLLSKHKTVRLINVPGNHDPDSTLWLALVMDAWFRNEPRVEVETSPAMFHFHQFGKNMICVTHGHTVKLPEIPATMAALQPEMWGQTKYRVAWTGHVHHSQQLAVKEHRGAVAESFGVLPPSDAYSASMGYVSQREMHSITFKRSGGILCRNTFNAALQ